MAAINNQRRLFSHHQSKIQIICTPCLKPIKPFLTQACLPPLCLLKGIPFCNLKKPNKYCNSSIHRSLQFQLQINTLIMNITIEVANSLTPSPPSRLPSHATSKAEPVFICCRHQYQARASDRSQLITGALPYLSHDRRRRPNLDPVPAAQPMSP
ncbi:hypothetical protein M0R45_030167 [Rubus argutus]|uniref:Uncharacterized protein n=1 Tax=Rubus argutus TaxID=59490 RepID=A0AAW1W9W3_RUBAR